MRFQQQPYATLTASLGGVVLRSSYSPSLVAELKSLIPSSLRKFDGNAKTWTFAPQYATAVADLCQRYVGVRPVVPAVIAQTTNPTVTKLIELRYLGVPKNRGDDEPTAFGFVDNGWNAIFTLSVLKSWFAEDSTPSQALTLYGVLGVKRDATQDEVRSAYRRAARTYHPDVNHEPDAAEQFRRIRAAWDVLGDETKRAKYNAGLALEASLHGSISTYNANQWIPPLRCGYLVVEGVESIGRINVTKILTWQDITRNDGAVLVTSWPAGAKTFTETWIP